MITLSIDWEDFGQLFGKYHYNVISDPVKGAIERQTDIILDLLDDTGNKATFFILGILAKYRAQIVRKIASRGHEISIHGQNHKAMFLLSRDEARKDLEYAYKNITDIIGKKVYGFRAPFFSIISANLYALEILADLGIVYDSSVFPMKLYRYGIDNFDAKDRLYKLANGKEIVELPLTVYKFFGKRWPVSGGGYIRFMPKFLVNKIYDQLVNSDFNSMIYMHPYEFDSKKIDITSNYPKKVSQFNLKVRVSNLYWNLFRDSMTVKLKDLLSKYKFNTCLERAIYVKNSGDSPKILG